MRTLILGLAAAGLMAGSAFAGSHVLVPGTDQIVAPAPTLASDDRVATPPVGQAGRQTGIAGNADGSNDFPRAHPDPGSIGPAYPNGGTAPSTWKGSALAWTKHSKACAAMYNTYDRSTDQWTHVSGAKSLCPASLGVRS